MSESSTRLTRRHALAGAAVVGVGVPLLAACGGGDDEAVDTAPAAEPGTELTTAGDVEVGGGSIFPDEKVVVTQPTEGEFKCFSAVCTHQGCLVSKIESSEIVCTCHNSRFSISDGSVVSGPAKTALTAVELAVEGDAISLA